MNIVAIKPKFIETLKKKLTHGNTRSILLNAIPGRIATRLPLNDLNIIHEGLANQFINHLTNTDKFKLTFTIDYNLLNEDDKKKLSRINKRLQNIKYEHDDNNKELGVETFGFGFPIILRRKKKDVNKFIAAPLFIWKLNIFETYKKTGQWCIERTSDHDIRVNEIFASYLESEENVKIESLSEEVMEDGILDESEINEYINKLLPQLNHSEQFQINNSVFDKFPDKLADKDLKNDTYIINSGVFGIYKSQKQSIIKEKEKLFADFNNILNIDPGAIEWDNNHSPINTDPSQNGVLRSLKANPNIVIQGPPGTGKSQTLTAIIASSLANNKKVLVVCEKRTALEVLESNLTELLPALKSSICIIEDVVRDRKQIVETARNKAEVNFSLSAGFAKAVGNDISKFETRAVELEKQYVSLRTPINRNMLWRDLVAQWLDVEKNHRYDPVLRDISKSLENITDDSDIPEKINNASIVYTKIKDRYTELERLFASVETSKIRSREISYLLDEQSLLLNQLNPEIKNNISSYVTCSEQYIGNAIKKIITELELIDSILKAALVNRINPLRITIIHKIRAIFSGPYRNLLTQIQTIPQTLAGINEIHRKEFGNSISLEQVQSKLADIKTSVDQLRKTVVAHDLKQSVKNVRKYSDFDIDKWHQITTRLQKSITEISGYITLGTASIESIPIEKLEEEVGQIKAKIDNAKSLSHLFEDYFEWRRLTSDFSTKEKEVISLLLEEPPAIWTVKVADAFLYNKLKKEDIPNRFPADDATLKILSDLGHQIRNYQKAIISDNIKYWNTLANNKYKASGIPVKQLFNLRGSKGNKRNTLRSIIQTNFDAFTDYFPVLLMNPTTVTTLLPLKRGLVDSVIFDEASQLRIEDTFSSLIRGKQIIVSGDSQQMPPSNYFAGDAHLIDDDGNESESEEEIEETIDPIDSVEMAKAESLLEFAIENGFQETYLDMHYRSRHPDLIEFSNVCFYKSRLLPMPEHNGYSSQFRPITYTHVNGLNIKGTNPDECKEILRLLKEEIDEKMSVGVATFNIQQRNYILSSIGHERETDSAFNKKMTAFEENGFFVKNLENIQGDERDIIILSTTFGNKPDKKFTLGLGPISGSNGHRLLNVIITRAKYKLFVITSIPESRIGEYRDRIAAKGKVDGTSGLLGYLDYARAVSSGDDEAKNAILKFIETEVGNNKDSLNNNNNQGLSESPFEEEVYNWLTEEIDKNRITQQYKCGGFRLDMVVLPKSGTGKKLAIECDGAAYHSDQLSWHHDIYRQKILEEQHGFVFYRIWSTNWWRNSHGEFKKLLSAINEFDKN